MSTDAPGKSRRAHRAGLTVCVEGSLPPEIQQVAVRAFAALATALLLDEPMEPEVLGLDHLAGGGLVAAAGSR
jgi:hypothetical protein